MPTIPDSSARRRSLREAEAKAVALFAEAGRRNLIAPGVSEAELNEDVYALAFEMYGIKKYWHKRIVRAGANTLCLYRENPPELVLQEDDIGFFDFGPVFEEWEADLGRTFVLGTDATKLRMQRDIEECWGLGKRHFDSHPDITGNELYQFFVSECHARGWEYALAHSGHLIGNFPHESIHGNDATTWIRPDNHVAMRAPAKDGSPRDWILELQFMDRDKRIGAFFEQLLTVDGWRRPILMPEFVEVADVTQDLLSQPTLAPSPDASTRPTGSSEHCAACQAGGQPGHRVRERVHLALPEVRLAAG